MISPGALGQYHSENRWKLDGLQVHEAVVRKESIRPQHRIHLKPQPRAVPDMIAAVAWHAGTARRDYYQDGVTNRQRLDPAVENLLRQEFAIAVYAMLSCRVYAFNEWYVPFGA